MMQTTNNFPMFGWIVMHFQEGKQIFHVFILHHGPILKKKMEDECKLNKLIFYYNTCSHMLYHKIIAPKHIQALIEHMLNSFSKNNIPLLPHL
jgi:hypothetical protein